MTNNILKINTNHSKMLNSKASFFNPLSFKFSFPSTNNATTVQFIRWRYPGEEWNKIVGANLTYTTEKLFQGEYPCTSTVEWRADPNPGTPATGVLTGTLQFAVASDEFVLIKQDLLPGNDSCPHIPQRIFITNKNRVLLDYAPTCHTVTKVSETIVCNFDCEFKIFDNGNLIYQETRNNVCPEVETVTDIPLVRWQYPGGEINEIEGDNFTIVQELGQCPIKYNVVWQVEIFGGNDSCGTATITQSASVWGEIGDVVFSKPFGSCGGFAQVGILCHGSAFNPRLPNQVEFVISDFDPIGRYKEGSISNLQFIPFNGAPDDCGNYIFTVFLEGEQVYQEINPLSPTVEIFN